MYKVAVVGATGYVGEELTRLLQMHPKVDPTYLMSHSYVDQKYSDVYPNFYQVIDEACIKEDLVNSDPDIVFMALPHGLASAKVTKELLGKSKVIDLGADFRLDIPTYEAWYKVEHHGKDIAGEAVYGLCEWQREKIKEARLIANPGCYVTCSLLSLLPLVEAEVIDVNSIIIDGKSGISGAGRGLNIGTHYTECNESFKAYGIASHRHTPEIERYLAVLGGQETTINFTPHLVPMNRGILTTIYATIKPGVTEEMLYEVYHKRYKDEQFIRVLPEGKVAETRWVKGSNYCDISLKVDSRTNRVIVVSCIDNLLKGAAGQAIHNMNLMMGWEESLGIQMLPAFPI